MESSNSSSVDAGLQPKCDLRVGPGVEHVPAFCLSVGLAHTLRAGVVRMDLDGKLFCRKQELDEQRETVFEDSGGSHQITLILASNVSQCASGERTVGDTAIAPGEPAFADRLLDDPGVDGAQIEYAPGPLVEDRNQQEWVESGHWI